MLNFYFVRVGCVLPRLAGVAAAFSAACALLGTGCSSGSDGAGEPPIVDPGGPFSTSVPRDRRLADLDEGEVTELCGEIGAVDRAYLGESVVIEETCRSAAAEQAEWDGRDASAATPDQLLTACQSDYEQCKTYLTSRPESGCVLPLRRDLPCEAATKVGDLSACLNELAATHPIAIELCVHEASCAKQFGPATMGNPPTDAHRTAPPTPACDALGKRCPAVVFEFPCDP